MRNPLEYVLDLLFKRADILRPDGIYLRRWFIGYSPSPVEVWRSRWYNRWLSGWLIRRAQKKYGHLNFTAKEVYLHKAYQSDIGEDPHDHPWDFITRVLWNGYNDHMYRHVPPLKFASVDVRGSRSDTPEVDELRFLSVRFRPAEHTHFVKKHNSRPMWTLVVRGTYRREWNFVKPDGTLVMWRVYTNNWGPNPFDPEGGL